MLAKQGWCILQNPESLVAKILKVRYFPHCSILNASLGYSPSYTWRSIFGALDIVKRGMGWRVGSSQEIQIWHDKWLPTLSTFCVMSTPQIFREDASVVELIDVERKVWRHDLIDAIFLPFEADMIKPIPIPHFNMEDKIIWTESFRGLFSVKSAYHLEFSRRLDSNQNVGDSSNGAMTSSSEWTGLWSLKLLPKIKMFMW